MVTILTLSSTVLYHLRNVTLYINIDCLTTYENDDNDNNKGFDAGKHWLAVSSILLIIGAASVAVPLALRVAASKCNNIINQLLYLYDMLSG